MLTKNTSNILLIFDINLIYLLFITQKTILHIRHLVNSQRPMVDGCLLSQWGNKFR